MATLAQEPGWPPRAARTLAVNAKLRREPAHRQGGRAFLLL